MVIYTHGRPKTPVCLSVLCLQVISVWGYSFNGLVEVCVTSSFCLTFVCWSYTMPQAGIVRAVFAGDLSAGIDRTVFARDLSAGIERESSVCKRPFSWHSESSVCRRPISWVQTISDLEDPNINFMRHSVLVHAVLDEDGTSKNPERPICEFHGVSQLTLGCSDLRSGEPQTHKRSLFFKVS